MASSHDLGRRGEAFAVVALERDGWTIEARNFRIGHKEVDVVARRGRVVAFIEVKTRASLSYGHPLEAIGRGKRREIAKVALAWITRHGRPGDCYRFDAVSVIWEAGGAPVLTHLEDAWRL